MPAVEGTPNGTCEYSAVFPTAPVNGFWKVPGATRYSTLGLPRAGFAGVAYPDIRSGTTIVFPRDHGSHPDFRTEWWYVTGWTADPSGVARGVQVTFFRNRPGIAESSASAFARIFQASKLTKRRVVAIDLPGYGNSE